MLNQNSNRIHDSSVQTAQPDSFAQLETHDILLGGKNLTQRGRNSSVMHRTMNDGFGHRNSEALPEVEEARVIKSQLNNHDIMYITGNNFAEKRRFKMRHVSLPRNRRGGTSHLSQMSKSPRQQVDHNHP